MRRKVVVTMSLAWWVEDADDTPQDDDGWIHEIDMMDEIAIMEAADEVTPIKTEITEHKP